ncbi:MAG: isoamylase early set domain-containing protein [Caldilineaceae bacterium]
MIYKYPSVYPGHVSVVFELPSCLWADRIFLVGDFNNWDERATPMRQERDGVWRAVVDLPINTRQQFRYLIDGVWRSDYHADGFAVGVYGEDNSVVHATLPAPVMAGAADKVQESRPKRQAPEPYTFGHNVPSYTVREIVRKRAASRELVAA